MKHFELSMSWVVYFLEKDCSLGVNPQIITQYPSGIKQGEAFVSGHGENLAGQTSRMFLSVNIKLSTPPLCDTVMLACCLEIEREILLLWSNLVWSDLVLSGTTVWKIELCSINYVHLHSSVFFCGTTAFEESEDGEQMESNLIYY